ncbi:MAG: hypothetical protein PVI81_00890 [Anaerolineales bacterium]|jgi:hypothetical protein
MPSPVEHRTNQDQSDPSLQPLLKSIALELIIYAPLVIIYFLLVLRYADMYLADLYLQNTTYYAIASLVAIVAQGVLLERLTTWLLHRFGLRK